MSIMIKKVSIMVKLDNMLYVWYVGAHMDLSMLTNTTNKIKINHKI